MKILLTLSPAQLEAFTNLMVEDLQTNKSAYFAYLIAQEQKRRREPVETKRPPGRPRKDENVAYGDFPDENAPRTLPLPDEFKQYVLPKDRAKLVNEYDIEMLQAKKESHEASR